MAEQRRHLAGLGRIGTRTLILGALAVLVVAGADRLNLRWDWSASGTFSLDPRLTEIVDAQTGKLEAADERIEMVAIWPRNLGGAWGQIGRLTATCCELLAERSPRISYRHLDSDLDQPELASFAERYREAVPFSLYVARRPATDDDPEAADDRAFRIPFTRSLPSLLQREIGGALLSLARSEQTPIYFLQGHGELRPGADGGDGLDLVLRRLELAGFRPQALDDASLLKLGRIPDGGVLLLPGPTSPLGDEILRILHRYLQDGGACFVAGDDRLPGFNADGKAPVASDLALYLRFRGIVMGPNHPRAFPPDLEALFDRDAPVRPARNAFSERSAGRKGYHRLLLAAQHLAPTAPMATQAREAGRNLLFPRATPVEAISPDRIARTLAAADDPGAAGPLAAYRERYAAVGTPPFTARSLLQLHPGQAWLGVFSPLQSPPDELPQRPVHLGWTVEYEPHPDSAAGDRRCRLVVWGSRQALADEVWQGHRYANDILLVDCLRWLARRDEGDHIPAGDFTRFQIAAGETARYVLAILLMAVLPCCCLGIAMLAWLERRRG